RPPTGRETPQQTPSTSATAASQARATTRRAVGALSRTPFALIFTLALIVVAAISGALFTPAENEPWFSRVATGIPAFAEGRWWSPITSMFFVGQPWVYLFVIPLVLGSLAWAEWRFGTLRTI